MLEVTLPVCSFGISFLISRFAPYLIFFYLLRKALVCLPEGVHCNAAVKSARICSRVGILLRLRSVGPDNLRNSRKARISAVGVSFHSQCCVPTAFKAHCWDGFATITAFRYLGSPSVSHPGKLRYVASHTAVVLRIIFYRRCGSLVDIATFARVNTGA